MSGAIEVFHVVCCLECVMCRYYKNQKGKSDFQQIFVFFVEDKKRLSVCTTKFFR